MLIGIDASRANKPRKTGVEWYSYHLIEEFKKIDRNNHYFLYTNKPLTNELARCPSNFEEQMLRWPLPRLWTLGRLSLEMKFGRRTPDVLFVPAHTIPFFNPKRVVVTVHDIGFEHFSSLYPWADKLYHRFSIQFIKRFADKIITVSNFSKRDLVETYKIPAEKIAVVYNGYDESFYKITNYGLRITDYKYILFIGRLEEKKNVARLVEAFGIFKRKHQADKHKLVLIGRPGFGFECVQKIIDEFGLQNVVIMLGWIEEKELSNYLNQADLFVFPSLFEGFGIPILQAMACGCPVICSNTTSLPEISGEAALMFDPQKVENIASRMEQVLLNPEVSESLREKGLRQVQNFSWRKCAEQTLEVIQDIQMGTE
ncbi:glycosyltransferase family 4 protein [Candidatus Falkowbacteria bacterium]|nr:glycosyltransferase family 4 protein [Candidatus Falkowbacteria bacterium]